ncbi:MULTISPECIES: HNH endonuclease [Rhodobacterales]|uniref:HNH endonuclease n=1 Tax=Rhodobacterales TaxID=204455 RepID=UPI0022F09CC8|nr:hypothetical protein [Paracoccus albus]WBU62359.1 hypothetical protein PAF20_18355 [Paracoccus albus]
MAILDPDTNQRVPLDRDLAERYAKEVNAFNATECQHTRSELRRGFNKGGGPIVKKQCLDCGLLLGNPVKRTTETELLPEIDEAHNPDYEAKRKGEWDTVRRRYVAIQESRWRGSVEGKSYFQRSHADYLASREWAERRSLVMDRAAGLCEGCRKARAAEVHHLSYRNWGSEFLFELVALCGDCHDRIHRLNEDRETGCTGCVHAGDDGEWCHQFGMPSGAASIPGGACGSDRQGFVDAEDYG